MSIVRELKKRGRERQRECYKTTDLATECNNFTWEYWPIFQLANFPPSLLETERENLNS